VKKFINMYVNPKHHPLTYGSMGYDHPIWTTPSDDGDLGWIYEHPYGINQYDPTPYPDHPITQYLAQQRWLNPNQLNESTDLYEIMGKIYKIPKMTRNNKNQWVINANDYKPSENGAVPLITNRKDMKRRKGWDVPICKIYPRQWWLLAPALN
jgi:hypothetical protein